jgi:hypothetical protein
MHRTFLRLLLLAIIVGAVSARAQDAANPSAAKPEAGAQDAPKPETPPFRWVDFHSQADQPIIVWVTRALDSEKWTSIRDIGVMYDAALVITTQRSAPDAIPSSDSFQLWSVNLTNHLKTPLLKGVNLRWVDWMTLRQGTPRELAMLYDDCRECDATTYFTTFHYDFNQHILAPRWLRGGQTVPVWTGTAPQGVNLEQMYALLADLDGTQFLATWSHFDYGKQKPAEDYIYRYDVDPFSGIDRTVLVTNKDVETMKQRLCAAQAGHANVIRGDVSTLCQQEAHPRPERRPATSPPANNRGHSEPPRVPR